MAVGTSKVHEPWLLDEEERLGYDALLGEDEHYPLIDQIPGTEDDAHRGYEDPPPRTRGRRLATSGRLAPPLFDDMGLECAQCDTCAAPSEPTLGLGGEGGGRGGTLEVAWNRWEDEWHARLEEWWTRLPSIDQAAMHQCLGALGLFLAARFEQTLRRLRLPPRAPSALFESEEGCDFVRRGEGSTSAVLPEFPELPSVTTPEAFMATPFLLFVPRLLPTRLLVLPEASTLLPWAAAPNVQRVEMQLLQGLGLGAGAGVAAALCGRALARSCRRNTNRA